MAGQSVVIDLQVEDIVANGDCALLVRFADNKNRLVRIHALCTDLLAVPLKNMVNVIPASNSLTLVFSGLSPDYTATREALENRCQLINDKQIASKTHEIPVCYHADVAADLSAVAASLSVATEQLIDWHTQPKYVVAMLGFLPGFSYLNGNHEKLVTTRKATPAISVPPGSVAIAGKQTGIYALSSPGGWHVIGRTPLSMIDWQHEQQPMRFNPLDQVRFKAISLAEFHASEFQS